MRALDRKLLRDLKSLRGQIITICLLVAAGIAGYVAMQSAYRSMFLSRDAYYDTYRFAELFATAKRVPNQLESRLEQIEGVAQIQTRTVDFLRVPLPGEARREAPGQVISMPDVGRATLNKVHLTKGRIPEQGHEDEALLLQSFAEAHDVSVGDTLDVILKGTQRRVRIVGTAMSPEFVFAISGDVLGYKPGGFAVLWMRESAVAPSLDMKGAFNSFTATLQPGASEAEVLASVDRLLDRYGGTGAVGRGRQMSHYFVSNELEQLEVQATIIPLIFLGVAAFLVNVVLGRLVQLQRGQIATLRALGYSERAVATHFLKLVVVIVSAGTVVGIAGGAWMGRGLIDVYRDYFAFPHFVVGIDASVLVMAATFAMLTALVGAMIALRKVLNLQPAEAMRPPVPPTYSRGVVDRLAAPLLGPLGRMVLRDLRQRPLRLLVSSGAIALAVMILIVGRFSNDAIGHLMDLQFGRSMHEDVLVGLAAPVDKAVLSHFRNLPGVRHAEGIRVLPVRLSHGTVERDTSIQSYPSDSVLRELIDRDANRVQVPPSGLLLSDALAYKLGVRPGDLVHAKSLEGERIERDVAVTGVVRDMLGFQAYATPQTVERSFGVAASINTALLSVDSDQQSTTEERLYRIPAVHSVGRPADARANFDEQQGSMMLVMQLILAFFASIISVGIVYNNARVSLSMRQRDLASMRVLGFTRAEISSILLGELAVQVLLALPIGMWLGAQATEAILSTDPENFRLPVVISHQTYAFAVIVTSTAALVSALLVRRRLDKLDLIGVLKTRE